VPNIEADILMTNAPMLALFRSRGERRRRGRCDRATKVTGRRISAIVR
jgi:hypothetical protein